MQRSEDALPYFVDAAAIFEKLADGDPNNAELRSQFSTYYGQIGSLLFSLNRVDEALENYRKYVAIAQKVAAGDPASSTLQLNLWSSYAALGDMLSASQSKRAGRHRLKGTVCLFSTNRRCRSPRNNLRPTLPSVSGRSGRSATTPRCAYARRLRSCAVLTLTEGWLRKEELDCCYRAGNRGLAEINRRRRRPHARPCQTAVVLARDGSGKPDEQKPYTMAHAGWLGRSRQCPAERVAVVPPTRAACRLWRALLYWRTGSMKLSGGPGLSMTPVVREQRQMHGRMESKSLQFNPMPGGRRYG